MAPPSLTFRTIDIDQNADLCIRFRRDSFVCSFGSDEAFVEHFGNDGDRYIQWLNQRIAELPEGCVHVWDGDSIIGQMEISIDVDRLRGYIFLFYLVPSARGGGASEHLHSYALKILRQHKVRRVQLSVSPSNSRAVAYYEKHGWRDLGPRPGHEKVHLMQLDLE